MAPLDANGERKLILPPAMREFAASCGHHDPMRFYYYPLVGRLYRRRVEACLGELESGQRVLEVGFGSGPTFCTLAGLFDEVWGIDLESDCAAVTEFFRREGIATHLSNHSLLELPFEDGTFDAVLLISILEHLHPEQQAAAFAELTRVLKPGGQVVYGVPLQRAWMQPAFRLLGYDIRQHHFSSEVDVARAAEAALTPVRRRRMGLLGRRIELYEIGHYRRAPSSLTGAL